MSFHVAVLYDISTAKIFVRYKTVLAKLYIRNIYISSLSLCNVSYRAPPTPHPPASLGKDTAETEEDIVNTHMCEV